MVAPFSRMTRLTDNPSQCILLDTIEARRKACPLKPSGESAYDALIDEIRRGVFGPGDRLREEDASQRLGLSRTPVREALRRLESDGIVEHRPRVGAVVRKLTHPEIVELFEMRVVLERTAAAMAAKHAATAEIEALAALNDRIDTDRARPEIAAQCNQQFHRRLYLAGRNRFLVQAASGLNTSLLLLGPTSYGDPGRIDVVVAEHRALIAALRAGDADAAARAAEAHLQNSLRYRLRAVPA
jgi:DNA-binding GntR family transcriptional regulator